MTKTKNQPFYLILQNIRSLYNVGSFFRTADGLGIDKIFLCGFTGIPPRKEISKTALSAEETVPWEHYESTSKLIKKLKKEGVKIISLEIAKGARPLNKFKPKFPLALVVGNEIAGVSKPVLKNSDSILYIPMQGQKTSFNVAIAGAITAYQLDQFRH